MEKSDQIAQQIETILAGHDVSKDKRLDMLSTVFTKLAGKVMLDTIFLTEEELTAPPAVTWKNRDKSKKKTIIEHIEDQFCDRIGRGFRRSDVRQADMTSEIALQNWLKNPKNKLPDNWLNQDDPQAMLAMLYRDAITFRERKRIARLNQYKYR